ncbi:Lrp/AsnC family transcriptional regulator [Cupriavidus sp.]|jgi:Lrp/AsnC family leucine-responsive transcriptional regulator|uniref:Lrp/AsnC family transcriptional regulator n=1 Tax=Cupriavidus sp. TaxID=1873897 RepID=UPI0025BE7B34|nr:Lrp/AsnC family transcriptional regulator [Cupriavidus sp.]MCA3188664.1 Lrp/AsnC family transcriptional regulator [Cupriavidus sp.]MCA3199680.1 Lrp/AsnC family transcriptional regulator [Cupriavidus sp.]MCA3205154.1 Lrp/AsnC family transcriptional regulator [Cupriavidus sp.]MCA3208730.1 Lrp/AsnC family transcriptional regulator [Cupriavidus sp.]MCA3233569.1 Lrp/AsnC family transcriptional regulator [Cupriavidus sp.]
MSLDDTDRRILALLQQDARMPVKALAEQVGLSSPGASERLRRLEDRGVIRGFTVDVEPRTLGFSMQAIVRIRPLPGKLQAVQKLIEGIPEFAECDKVTGDDCFIGRLYLRSIEHLDHILEQITEMAETSSAIVKSQPVRRRLPPL